MANAAVSTVGIVADDVTGANDTAALFAAAGWPRVSSHVDVDAAGWSGVGGAGVLALCTSARALDSAAAARATEAGLRQLRAAGAQRVFVKVDSTLRGSVAAQVAAALRRWGSAHERAIAVLCPAHPAQGRTVSSGRLLVHGTDVAATEYVAGLATASSRLADLVPGTICLPAPRTGQAAALAATLCAAATRGDGVVAVDASSVAALRTVALAVGQLGTRALPVGSGGLGGALASVWCDGRAVARGPDLPDATVPERPHAADPDREVRAGAGTTGRVVVMSSSRSEVTRVQLGRVRELGPGAVWLQPSVADLLYPAAVKRWRVRAAGRALVLLSVAGPVSADGPAADTGSVAAGLGALAAAVLRDEPAGALVSVGGDGTAAVLRASGARGVRLTGWLPSGVALGTVEGGALAGLPVATKAGGFGAPGTIVETIRHLAGGPGPRRGRIQEDS